MSQMDYPSNQDGNRLQALAIQVGELKTGIDEMRIDLRSISKDRLEEAYEMGNLKARIISMEEGRKITVGWLSALSVALIVTIVTKLLH